MRALPIALLTAALAFASPLASASSQEDNSPTFVDPGPTRGEEALTTRLLAPCCWQQTLDIHDSELTRALRAEIRTRLRHGESAASIESALVQRYGERMRAMAKPGQLYGLLAAVGAALLLAGVAVFWKLRQWIGRGAHGPLPSPTAETAVNEPTSSSKGDKGDKSELGKEALGARDDDDDQLDEALDNQG